MGISALGIRLFYIDGPLVKRSRRRPLTPQTGVRFSHGSPRRNGLHSIQKAQPFGWAFLIPFRHSSFPHKTLQGKLLRGPRCRGKNERPGRMDCIPFKNSGKWLGFFHTISSFLFFPTKLCKANFCGAPLPGETNAPAEWTAFHSKAQANDWAFLIPFRHSSLTPQNFAKQTFVGTTLPGRR